MSRENAFSLGCVEIRTTAYYVSLQYGIWERNHVYRLISAILGLIPDHCDEANFNEASYTVFCSLVHKKLCLYYNIVFY